MKKPAKSRKKGGANPHRLAFKNSELGPIPADWEVSTLGQVIANGHAKLQTGPFGTVLKASEFVETGHPVVSVREIRSGYIQLYDDTPCVSDETYEKLGKYSLQAEDLVFARKGSVERSALIPSGGISYFLGSDSIGLRLDNDCLFPKYLLYYLQLSEIKQHVARHAYGTTMAGLNEASLRTIPLVIPPLPEQQRIAAALTDADAWIESLDKLIEKKKLVKQGAMQTLLSGKTRLSGFGVVGVKMSEVGSIPVDWEVKRLGEIARILDNRRVPLNDAQRRKGCYPYCGANGIVDYIDRYEFDEETVLIAEDGGNFSDFATRPIAYKMSGKYWVNNHAHVLTANAGYDLDYLFWQLVHKDITDFVTGGTREKLTRRQLETICVPAPSLKEQKAIAAVLSDMDAELAALSREKVKAEQIKQGMMQELLTGKIRL